MKIGILGGSFNPIHIGHLMLADEAQKAFALDTVLFVPAHVSPFKQDASPASDADRAEMIRRAIEGNDAFRLETCELERGGVSYTIDTVRFLRKKYEAEANRARKIDASYDKDAFCAPRTVADTECHAVSRTENASTSHDASTLHDTSAPRDASNGGGACGLGGEVRAHDASTLNDTSAPHDASALHDTSAPHDASTLHDTSAGTELFLIIGDDLVKGFASWRCAAELPKEATIVIARRSFGAERVPGFLYPHKEIQNALLPISSTDVRSRIKSGKSWHYLVPESVYRYINERHLYE